tara:strand:+ start:1449 stop:1901 length:453 start_codon:yes stop_codon:yes gene_type:complete
MFKHQIIQFLVMAIVGILFNPMNALAFKVDHLYFSLTLFYGGLLMASNMIWSHEVVHYLTMGHFSLSNFSIGIILSSFIILVFLRNQTFVDEKQWLLRMIPHHSTALTTTNKLKENLRIKKDKKLSKLADDIIDTQEREIKLMKELLKKY